MSRQLRQSRQLTVLVVGSLLLLALPAGLSLAGELSGPPTTSGLTPTPPPILNPTDTPTNTSTPTATSTPAAPPTLTMTGSSDGGRRNGSNSGQSLVVNDGSGVPDDADSETCANAEYKKIQTAVDDAARGDTVVVCAGTYTERVGVTTGNLTIRADGNAVIEHAGESAIRINAPRVTLQGFTVRTTQGASYAIEVGGRKTFLRYNTVNSTGVGIFLSDGLTSQGEPNSELRAATGSRVVNNTINMGDKVGYGIWTDADQTVVKANNFPVMNTTELEDETTRFSRPPGSGDPQANISIVSSGNETVIRDNTIQYSEPRDKDTCHCIRSAPGIQIGVSNQAEDRPNHRVRADGHNWANNNIVRDNSVSSAIDAGIWLREVAKGSVIRNNTVTNTGKGLVVYSNETVIRNNTVIDNQPPNEPSGGDGIVISGNDALVIGNIQKEAEDGIQINGANATIRNNIAQDNGNAGIKFVGSWSAWPWSKPVSTRILDNRFTGNRFGILIDSDEPTEFEVHRNTILDNKAFGINLNNYGNMDEGSLSKILNATNNIWDCGGPSGGLRDPYTNRTANGTGDPISAGDEPGVSNVHFDPFQEVSECPSLTSTPTPSPTPTPTQTPTPKPSPAGGGGGDGDGGGGTGSGAGTGDGGDAGSGEDAGSEEGGGGDSDAPSGSDDSGSSNSETATPPPTSSATPSSTPTATLSPTPAVEPGFGVVTWLVGVTLLVGFLVTRRRVASNEDEHHD